MAEPSRVIVATVEPDLSTVADMVDEEGFAVCKCHNDEEVRHEMVTGGAALVICQMPSTGADAFDLVNWVKELDPETQIVVITGDVTRDGETIFNHRNVDGHLVHPVQPRRLQILLQALLKTDDLSRTKDAYILAHRAPVVAQVEQVLKDSGMATELFSDPRALLSRACEEPPHLVVVDLATAPDEGLDLCETIRTDRSIPYLPILVPSDEPQREAVVRAAKLHINGFLTQPVDTVTLRSRVLKLWRHTKGT